MIQIPVCLRTTLYLTLDKIKKTHPCVFQDHIIRMEEQGPGGLEGAGPNNHPPVPPDVGLGAGLGAAHQAMLQGGGPVGFQPYKRPSFFVARVRQASVSISVCVSKAPPVLPG